MYKEISQKAHLKNDPRGREVRLEKDLKGNFEVVDEYAAPVVEIRASQFKKDFAAATRYFESLTNGPEWIKF